MNDVRDKNHITYKRIHTPLTHMENDNKAKCTMETTTTKRKTKTKISSSKTKKYAYTHTRRPQHLNIEEKRLKV